jgi:mitogen-activated protein kinase binding protein 1
MFNLRCFDAAGKKDKTDTAFQEKNGIRCVRVSPSGDLLASGDRVGNVRYSMFALNSQ